MRTNDIGITGKEHKTWWLVDFGNIYNLYNIRIQFKDYSSLTKRQRGRFAGFSLYVSNTTDRHLGHLCYKNGEELPPLDFNTNCTTHGRYVIFYNERLDNEQYPLTYETNNVITELCELTVTGCFSLDVYGSTCTKLCTDNCPEPRCNISTGACYNCAPGWMGDFCKKKVLFWLLRIKMYEKLFWTLQRKPALLSHQWDVYQWMFRWVDWRELRQTMSTGYIWSSMSI